MFYEYHYPKNHLLDTEWSFLLWLASQIYKTRGKEVFIFVDKDTSQCNVSTEFNPNINWGIYPNYVKVWL